jgi:nucleotide-binding universal stress UspA family protein
MVVVENPREGSIVAARWGSAVASLFGLHVELVQVLLNTAELLPSNEEWYIGETRKELAEWAKWHHLGDCAFHVAVADPGEELVRRAAGSAASMVIIGAHNEARHDRGHADLARHLARHLAQPIVVVPNGDVVVAGRPVVAGIEPGSDGIVLDWARWFAANTGGDVLALTSRPDDHDGTPDRGPTDAQASESGRRDPSVRYATPVGAETAETLAREAVNAGAALIVIGAKTRVSLAGMLLGTTAARLLDNPPIPVAVLPRTMLTS